MQTALWIEGPVRLFGTVSIEGAKNAALPCLAAALLTDAPVVLHRVPDVRDVATQIALLRHLGADVVQTGDTVTVRAATVRADTPLPELTRQMRASFLLLGPLALRMGRARVAYPGGCAIGPRPVDIHLAGLVAFGFDIRETEDFVEIERRTLRGIRFQFPRVTVTGTEHLLMVAAGIPDVTVLDNCAQEPEVVQLVELLCAMGAEIEGAGTSRLIIRGRRELGSAEITIIPDRIEAGTYAVAAAVTRGRVTLQHARPDHLRVLLDILTGQGVRWVATPWDLIVDACDVDTPLPLTIVTRPYPGFPTDLQAQIMVWMTQAEGVSEIEETVFPQRFRHAKELARMGARVDVSPPRAWVRGPTSLHGASVRATDLRASAGLVIAALCARGVTCIAGVHHLDRGYARLDEKLRALGARVWRGGTAAVDRNTAPSPLFSAHI